MRPTRRLLRDLSLWSVLLLAAHPSAAQSRDRAATVAAIDSIAAEALRDGRAAGLSIAVVRGRDTLVMRGYGYSDLEWDVPTAPRTLYEIGSVTKQFTAAALLQLQEQGKLDLDDDLVRYLPDYPTQGHHITLRRLLDHTSGIKGYTEMPGFWAMSTRKLPRDSLVALFSAEPFDFAPGEALVYNNSAYFLLGLVIEKVSGMSYADYVKRHLFDRAGMPDSRYCSENAVVKRRAHGYQMSPNGLVRAAYIDHTYPYAAGSLCSTAEDLVAWLQALHGGRILSPAAYRELITPGTLKDGTPLRYAKGVVPDSIAGHRAIHHGGGIPGFLSQTAYFPNDSLAVVVLANTAGPVSPDEITEAIAEVVLGRDAEPAERKFRGDLSRLAGEYRGVGLGQPLALTVVVSDGELVAEHGGEPVPLRYMGGTTFQLGETRRRLTFVIEGNRATGLVADMIIVVSRLQRQ